MTYLLAPADGCIQTSQRLTFVALQFFPEDIDLMTCKRAAFWTVVVAITLTSSVVQAADTYEVTVERGVKRRCAMG